MNNNGSRPDLTSFGRSIQTRKNKSSFDGRQPHSGGRSSGASRKRFPPPAIDARKANKDNVESEAENSAADPQDIKYVPFDPSDRLNDAEFAPGSRFINLCDPMTGLQFRDETTGEFLKAKEMSLDDRIKKIMNESVEFKALQNTVKALEIKVKALQNAVAILSAFVASMIGAAFCNYFWYKLIHTSTFEELLLEIFEDACFSFTSIIGCKLFSAVHYGCTCRVQAHQQGSRENKAFIELLSCLVLLIMAWGAVYKVSTMYQESTDQRKFWCTIGQRVFCAFVCAAIELFLHEVASGLDLSWFCRRNNANKHPSQKEQEKHTEEKDEESGLGGIAANPVPPASSRNDAGRRRQRRRWRS